MLCKPVGGLGRPGPLQNAENIMESSITVGCNILTSIDGIAYPNHCQNWYNWGKELSGKYKFYLYGSRRMSIDNMRNQAAVFALQQESEFLFFYDDDVLLPIDALPKLVALMNADENIGVAAGLTYVRGYPFPPMVFEEISDGGLKQVENIRDKEGVLSVGAVGFSCALLRTSYFKNMKPPYFVTASQCTEDVYYCCRLKTNYSEAKVVCDTSIDTSHIVDRYAINSDKFDIVKKFEEDFFGAKPPEKSIDRGIKYAERVQEQLA